VSYLPMELGGEPAVGVVLIDVSEREGALAAAQRRVGQHAAVAELGRRALAGTALSELLAAACETLRRELQADQAGVLEFVDDRSHLVMCAGSGFPDGAVGHITASVGTASQAGYTLMQKGPVLSGDVGAETRFEISEGMRSQGAVSVISTPISGGSEPFGVLGVFSRERNHFDEDDAGFVGATANVLAAAVARDEQARELAALSGQRGRLVAQALEAGEREQRQVADVLHDDVLQHLLFARQELTDARGDAAAIDRARKSVDDATGLLRRVVAGLHPVTLAHAGLAAALEGLAGEQRARIGLRTDVRVDPRAEGVHDRLLVSLARELLINVAKHAQAARALIEVSAHDGGVQMTVADDGRGMPDEAFGSALARGNIGLATTRERVEALGGMARVCHGLDGRGTSIEISLPT
jgi:signal transduction histidine kinase